MDDTSAREVTRRARAAASERMGAGDAARAPAKVVFACVHNAGRSQMAAAFFRSLADPSRAAGLSAGTEPAAHVHPEVIEAMREVGIDLSAEHPRRLTAELAEGARLLVTMGCGEACPYVPGAQVVDWPLDDPAGRPAAEVRRIRDEIRGRVEGLVREHGWGGSGRE